MLHHASVCDFDIAKLGRAHRFTIDVPRTRSYEYSDFVASCVTPSPPRQRLDKEEVDINWLHGSTLR